MERDTTAENIPVRAWAYYERGEDDEVVWVYRSVDALRDHLLEDVREYEEGQVGGATGRAEMLSDADPERILDVLRELSDAHRYVQQVSILPA